MLGFLRKYQRFFFLIVTIVIVITFSFFGAQPTSPVQTVRREEVAYTLPNGAKVSQGDVEEMVRFLATDLLDTRINPTALGFNFLNDGFVRNDILASGIGTAIVREHLEFLRPDLEARFKREQGQTPYTHPMVKFVGAETVWQSYAPPLFAALQDFRAIKDPASADGFDRRAKLFVAEGTFPSSLLRQVLMQQQRQYEWLQPDPSLPQRDLALFQYHSLEDWMGRRFLHLVAQTVDRVAAVAEQRGYEVTDAEVLADLMRNASDGYRVTQSNGAIITGNLGSFYTDHLRRIGMTEGDAVRIWRRVMLFRRIVDDMGTSVFTDPSLVDGYREFASRAVNVDSFEPPAHLRMTSFYQMQELQTYLSGVARNFDKAALDIPTQFLSVDEVTRNAPEFVQKRFEVEVTTVSRADLITRVGVRETWAWEQEEKNWDTLVERFPELAKASAANDEERFAAIEALEGTVRADLDRFARERIVDEHPEWVTEALEDAIPDVTELVVHRSGGPEPLPGITDRLAFVRQLEQGPLTAYSQDEQNFHNVTVVGDPGDWELVTFSQARAAGILEERLSERLKRHYDRIKDIKSVAAGAGEEWSSFEKARSRVAEDYFSSTLQAIRRAEGNALSDAATVNQVASHRLAQWLRGIRENLQNGGDVTKWVSDDASTFETQWKLASRERVVRRDTEQLEDIDALLAMSEGEFSELRVGDDGLPRFVRVGAQQDVELSALTALVAGHQELGRGARNMLLTNILDDVQRVAPMQLDYLIPTEES